jgi:hypothetical protein
VYGFVAIAQLPQDLTARPVTDRLKRIPDRMGPDHRHTAAAGGGKIAEVLVTIPLP